MLTGRFSEIGLILNKKQISYGNFCTFRLFGVSLLVLIIFRSYLLDF